MNSTESNTIVRTIPVTGMTCAACASSVESMLSHTAGIVRASVNFATSSVLVEYTPDTDPKSMQSAVQSIGYDLIMDEENAKEVQRDAQHAHYESVKRRTIWSAVLTTPIFSIGMFAMHWEPGKWISMVLSIPILFIFGKSYFIGAWKNAKYGKANMDTLVALSTGIAFLFSVFNTLYPSYWLERGLVPHVYYEAATVIITFITMGKWMEEKAKSNTSSAIKKLIGLQPNTVIVMKGDQEREIPIKDVKVGDVIRVKPGMKVPLDGRVVSGESYVDESMITGEPIAVLKRESNDVFAGTVNQKGSFEFEATKIGSETLLAQIIEMVERAQGSKAPVQKVVDRVAAIFVPTVISIAILTFAIWMIWGGENAFTHALLTSVTVLVIACPCALGLATPTAIMVGMGKGADHQILIRDAESLELAHKVDVVVLDKTGTITEGKPSISGMYWIDNQQEETWKSILLAMEEKSEHPLAEAITNQLMEEGNSRASLSQFESITGKGVRATTSAGHLYYVGNKKLMEENKVTLSEEILHLAVQWSDEAQTVIYFANEQRVVGLIGITDRVKSTSKQAVEKLLARNIEVHILTGDNLETARAVAHNVGVKHYRGEMLPSEKANYIQDLQQSGKTVAMIGDGINDSQALAQADVSIAMATGSDIAMDVAKITLMSSDLASVPKALNLSKKTVLGIRQNLFWAFIYNIIGIPLAAGILYPFNGFLLNPMIAGAAMAFSSVSVVLNSLRLRSARI
ncbi:heavy metal translocating P-type ATPase [Phaeocystidibacter marisrubri]|uniref:Copper-translocating P-type ATPase n=1 Tax=Phaeocystidibacter marisrubri TaxID=1577780 RepID=A0A6L3ZF85_9FLAO|nr:heavy metal translocating P-type ATPase [Phaeocystidibacter marisrubri]KAB2815549.1 copper-translocating P-type ATPase [Phaeocystidibacter marisrubri]